jgi:formyltetrahydrofolate-dependent phosphoribosylglycinamide formyltransferase
MSALSPADAALLRDRLDAAGQRLVFTSGCFDLLHVGHVRYLQEARALGDQLCIALNSDRSVRELKGPDRPINSEADRAEVLLALECVDAVVIFDEPRTTKLIQTIRPHVFAKGGDYTIETLNPEERSALFAVKADIQILREVKGKSTTATIAKMKLPEQSRKPRLAILGSGVGTNAQAIMDAISAGELAAEIALVLSDQPQAKILERAKQQGIPQEVIDTSATDGKFTAAIQQQICDRLRAVGADLIVLAGFMRILKGPVLAAFPKRIINVHPSLLPAYQGKDAIPRALAAGEKETGCSVHYVDAGIDTGEVIAQSRVPILPDDTETSLTARIQAAEHLLLPKAIGELLGKTCG